MKNMTAADTIWRKVKEELVNQNALGSSLTLRCDIHGTLTSVSTAQDFEKCPQGGCLQLCRLLLSCGHYCQQVCHTNDRDHKTFRCTEPCQKEICPKKHICPDLCYKECRPCMVPKTVMLSCGHNATMPCHYDPEIHKCKTKVTSVLPLCEHENEVMCYQTAALDVVPCKIPCTVRMDCGHVCERKCHKLDDPLHEKTKCFKPCGQKKIGCTQDHMCMKRCFETCEDCDIGVKKLLPCGHTLQMACKDDPATKKCKQKCERTLDCERRHKCRKLCYEDCHPCKVKVKKIVTGCGHSQDMACSADPSLFRQCNDRCGRVLACGHRCKLKCSAPCEGGLCKELVPFLKSTGCGHKIQVPCHQRNSFVSGKEHELLSLCKEPCNSNLACEHLCAGTCGSCWQGRFHMPCRSKCGRTLICGHVCKAPCAESCPPCTQECAMECSHSKCHRPCGAPCVPCKEQCQRSCPHQRCAALCGDLCPQGPCSEPCAKKIAACDHDCIGLCGDTCLCRECNEDKIDIFFGTEDDEGARFVVLPDCGHIFESSGLDHWMLQDGSGGEKDAAIIKKVCPQCTQLVTKSQRYSNIIKQNALDVAQAKAKIYGNWKTIGPAARIARLQLQEVPAFPKGFDAASRLLSNANSILKQVDDKFGHQNRGSRQAPPHSLTGIQNLAQYVGILTIISQIVVKALKEKLSDAGWSEVRGHVENLCSNLMKQRDLLRLSPQEALDLNMELERLQRVAHLCQIESGPSFRTLSPADKNLHLIVSEAVRSPFPYTKKEDRFIWESLRQLALKASVLITQEEKQQIVAALGMGKGHWFKCKNGHPYVITECGGAMQESTCPDCGAGIGGQNHQLRSDNRLAGDMDGAARPAWPTALM